MLNRAVLIGRLTADPQLRYTSSGIAVVAFTLAVERKYKNAAGEKITDFIDIEVWRKAAENCAKYLHKGSLAAVDGSLQLKTYTDKNGSRHKAAVIVAEDIRFLSTPAAGVKPLAESPDTAGDEPLFDTQLPF